LPGAREQNLLNDNEEMKARLDLQGPDSGRPLKMVADRRQREYLSLLDSIGRRDQGRVCSLVTGAHIIVADWRLARTRAEAADHMDGTDQGERNSA